MTRARGAIGLALALFAGTSLAGCGPVGTEGSPGPAAEATTGTLVASVDLSPTHSLRFFDYGGEVVAARESLHMDADRDAPMTLAKMQVGDRPFADIYQMFAGGRADGGAVARLRAIDARLARLEREPARTGGEFDLTDAAPALPELDRSTAAAPANLPAGIDVQRGAAVCTQPPWDWAAEGVWYRNNFCQGVPNLCRFNTTAPQGWGWDGPLRRFQVTAMNQSHCSAQGWWIFQWQNGGGVQTPTNTVLGARVFHTEVWSGGKNVLYKTTMTARDGGPIGLTIFRTAQ